MDSYTMQGTILLINEPVVKSEKFTLYEMLLKREGEYNKVPVSFQLNEKCYEAVKNAGEGAPITLHFNIDSREYNMKHFTTLKGWKVE